MKIHFFEPEFSVCQLPDGGGLDLSADFFFLAKTPDELSLVCPSDSVPIDAIKAEHGWRMFRIEGQLDFGLVGILARITRVLAEREISVYAVSTYDTDYVMIKAGKLDEAREALGAAGYEIA